MAQACPECRTENADGATFCRACGVPLQALVAELPDSDAVDSPHCDDCGHRNPSGARFCERCGYELAPWLPEWAEDDAVTPPAAKSEPSPPSPASPSLPPPLPAAWSHAAVAGEDTFDPLSAPTLVMSHTAPTPLTQPEPSEAIAVRRRPLRWVATGLALLGAFALMAWLAGPSAPPPAKDAAPAPVAAPASVAAAASVATPALAPAPASAPESTRAEAPPAAVAVPTPASTPTPASAPALVPSAPAAIPAAATSAPAARKRLPEPVARKRAQEAPALHTEAAPPAAAPAPPVAAPAAPPPERARTVAELCAGSNLLMRGFCEQRECRRAELAADPACVKLRDAEQRRLFQQ